LRPQSKLRVGAAVAASALSLSATGTAMAAQTPAQPAQTAAASAITASKTRLDVLRGSSALISGKLRPGKSGRQVLLERRDGRQWKRLAADATDASGRYTLKARAKSTGSALVRVRFAGDPAARSAQRTVGRLNVYRSSLASRYDAYGGPLACGGRLGYDSMVVANKSLPCGTKLTIRYRGRTVKATVRDRGPYVGGREFDLAGAVARKLRFDGVGQIWVTR
jgi:rare lipoprotein A (peptidoglycan hydrolase)